MIRHVSQAVRVGAAPGDRKQALRFVSALTRDPHLDVAILKARITAGESWFLLQISGSPAKVGLAVRRSRQWTAGA